MERTILDILLMVVKLRGGRERVELHFISWQFTLFLLVSEASHGGHLCISDRFVATTINPGRMIFAIATSASAIARKSVAEAFAILADAPIVLAGTAQTDLSGTSFKGIGTLFQRRLNGVLPVAARVFFCIQAANTRANSFLASLLLLKTCTV